MTGTKPLSKGQLHPRNRHQGRYDLERLVRVHAGLQPFVKPNAHGEVSIDFANPAAVKALNRALLHDHYGLEHWDIPNQYLCPPIPGRADYVHHAADLLKRADGSIPLGPEVRVLDIGVGANCIYPILGHLEYGWRFVGSDIDEGALQSAAEIIRLNSKLRDGIELRRQQNPSQILKGVVKAGERFDLTLCNPPFHASAEEADEVNRRKWRNLGKAAVTNFGGRSNELWCEGGEVAFVSKLMHESADFPESARWFTALVSKESSLLPLGRVLDDVNATVVKTIEMSQGQKKSRFMAWSFR